MLGTRTLLPAVFSLLVKDGVTYAIHKGGIRWFASAAQHTLVIVVRHLGMVLENSNSSQNHIRFFVFPAGSAIATVWFGNIFLAVEVLAKLPNAHCLSLREPMFHPTRQKHVLVEVEYVGNVLGCTNHFAPKARPALFVLRFRLGKAGLLQALLEAPLLLFERLLRCLDFSNLVLKRIKVHPASASNLLHDDFQLVVLLLELAHELLLRILVHYGCILDLFCPIRVSQR
mmetsp:Transcript_128563/g.256811  ORF Transcript_128563/g.256811 Transcript_128563/m.256811 type:complete len:229 (-) Transcript_128563:1013-1699(-)